MSSAYGPDGSRENESPHILALSGPTIECQLFESLVHHLIEKGVMNKNDALTVVQTVAEVKRGFLEERPQATAVDQELGVLTRLYSSFELVRDSASASQAAGSENVLQLRPPLHDDLPKFPRD